MTAPAIPSSAYEFHTRHKQRLEKFAAAAARHAANVNAQRDAALAAILAVDEAARDAVRAAAEAAKAKCKAATRRTETPDKSEYPHVNRVQSVVADHFGVTVVDLKSARRTHNLILPRQIAMYLAKTLTLRSYPDIAQRFGKRDHTTVVHAVRKIERLIVADAVFAATIAALKALLATSPEPPTTN
jgi:chromosomal replication initiator protein